MKTGIDIHQSLERTLRDDRGRLLAALGSYLGNYTLAEDALQQAMESALNHWQSRGIPENPRGWLLQVGRRKALDTIRRSNRHTKHLTQLSETADQPSAPDPHDIPDHRLRLIFTCCHPALDLSAQVALTLRALGGLTTDEVARAFLVKPATMGQRISRAKSKIKAANIPFAMPDLADMHSRVDVVLQVIYLIYNEGYSVTEGTHQLRIDLCEEALFLARLLATLSPDAPEVRGLLALILFSHARRSARLAVGSGFVPLDKQDRTLWDSSMIVEAQDHLAVALPMGQVGPYQLQAAIHGVHCDAERSQDTDWAEITGLYKVLLLIEPSAVTQLNFAVALSYAEGPERAISILEALEPKMQSYQPYFAARADIYARMNWADAARVAYDRAIELSGVDTEKRHLLKLRDRLAEPLH